jgi:hypothetical protein
VIWLQHKGLLLLLLDLFFATLLGMLLLGRVGESRTLWLLRGYLFLVALSWFVQRYANLPLTTKLVDARAMKNPETGGWRAFFKLDVPEKTNLLELTCELQDKDKKVISERWSYQWRR